MTRSQTTTIELAKENMKFSAGHFTIFSATERERLHGHNFNVSVRMTAAVGDNGMCFDYGNYKTIIERLCREWNEYFILPGLSPYLNIESRGEHIHAVFNGQCIPFLKEDVLVLPIANATLEEFSRLTLQKLTADKRALADHGITAMAVKVFSGPGQSCGAVWPSSVAEEQQAEGTLVPRAHRLTVP